MHGTLRRLPMLGALLVALVVALLQVHTGVARAGSPEYVQVPWGEEGLCDAIPSIRDLLSDSGDPISAGTNVAAFKVNLPNGKVAQVTMTSKSARALEGVPPADGDLEPLKFGHSERRLLQLLQEAGLKADDVTEVCSELEPCTLPGAYCKNFLNTFPNLKKVYYNESYPNSGAPKGSPEWLADKRARAKGVRNLRRTVTEHEEERQEADSVMDPGASCSDEDGCEPGEPTEQPEPESSPITDDMTDPFEALDPGGIDFTSLQLRYLSLSGGNVQYAMDSDGAPVTTDPGTGLQTAQEDSTAFFDWLTLPTSSFWVNLSPNTPPQIIDPRMALTDAGHVMLQSDLLLKEAITPAENPATPDGLQYWQGLANLPAPSAADSMCVSYRIWIVPGIASVHATKTQLYILNAPLNVRLAVVKHLPGKLLHPICSQDPYTAGQIALVRQWILPQLRQEVNTAPQFEPLRRIYMSRVAAQWVRQEAGPNSVMGRLVDSGLHRSWIARPSWSASTIWHQYLQSFVTPTHYTATVQVNGAPVTYNFTAYGGVDLRHKVREHGTSNRQFKAHYPGLAKAAKKSMKHPSKAGGMTLVGGGIRLRPKPQSGKRLKKAPFYILRHGTWHAGTTPQRAPRRHAQRHRAHYQHPRRHH